MLQAISDWLYDPIGLTPHGFCLLWEPGLIWTHALADTAIAIAYFTIPAALTVVARRRKDLVFRPMFWLFAAFIMLCGTEHVFEVLTLWVPAYGWQALVKVATALTSTVTAVALWWLLPRGLALPSPRQLQEAHAALQASEARHRANFERSPVPLHTLDLNGCITSVSDSWLARLGYRADEVIGRQIRTFTPDGWSTTDVARLHAQGELRDLEQRFAHRDGSPVDMLVTARLEHQDGMSWVACVLIDISARRRAEAALHASEERLRQSQKMEAVGQLTGGIAHDFNNMLQGISGGIDLLELRIGQGRVEDAGRYVAMARQSVERASALTSRMLAFARRQSLQPRAVDPASLVRGIEELMRRTIGPSVRLALRHDDNSWNARCDGHQLETALLNLGINARDAMPDGGTLTLATADRRVDEIAAERSEIAPGDYVEFAVGDTGTGMAPAVKARAFEPFFTTKPIGQGTGLGLSQVYGFVRQSGGAVLLESVPGEGTTVRLLLPRDTAPVSKVDTRVVGKPPMRTARGAVLLVEDEAEVRAIASEALRDLGCQVLEAADGPSGLAIVQSNARVDLLVTDVGLPGLNGRQLAEAAREWRPGLPVLLVTGYAGTVLDDLDLAPGIEILRKPFPLDDLTARACAMLERAGRVERPAEPVAVQPAV